MVIAAVRSAEDFQKALLSAAPIIFDLKPDIFSLKEKLDKAHRMGKKLFIHMDLAEGIGKDRAGIRFAQKIGVDGVISTRTNIIKMARELGIFTVQRFFVVDSQSVHTTLESVKNAKPDMMEVMPGVMEKVIEKLKGETQIPIIAGGLIETREEIHRAVRAGAAGVSTGNNTIWYGEEEL